jgi:hypothetical protein
MVNFSEHDNTPLSSVKWEFIDQASNFKLFRKDPTTWSQFLGLQGWEVDEQ